MKEDTKGRPRKRKRHDKQAVPVLLRYSAGDKGDVCLLLLIAPFLHFRLHKPSFDRK